MFEIFAKFVKKYWRMTNNNIIWRCNGMRYYNRCIPAYHSYKNNIKYIANTIYFNLEFLSKIIYFIILTNINVNVHVMPMLMFMFMFINFYFRDICTGGLSWVLSMLENAIWCFAFLMCVIVASWHPWLSIVRILRYLSKFMLTYCIV